MNQAAFAKVTTIGSLYMGQTIAVGFISQLLPTIYREQGLALERFWVFSVCLAPFALRFLWAPLVDRHGSATFGWRKAWLLPCTLLAAVLYLSLGAVEPTVKNLPWIAGLVAIVAVVLATQETAVDAYFVENLAPAERGLGSAVRGYMESFAELGALAGLGYVYHQWGWTAAVGTAAGLLILFTTPGIIRRETPLVRRQHLHDAPQPSVREFLRRPDTRLLVPILICAGLAMGMYFVMLGAFLIDKGFAVDQTGLILGVCVVLGWVVGGPVAVSIVERLGLRRTLRLFVFAFLPCFLSAVWLANVPRQSLGVTIAALTLPTLVLAQFTILSYIARLGWCSQAQAGTDFSTQGAAVRLGAAAAAGVGGAIAAAVGWRYFFVFYALYATLSALLFWRLEPRVSALTARRLAIPHPA